MSDDPVTHTHAAADLAADADVLPENESDRRMHAADPILSESVDGSGAADATASDIPPAVSGGSATPEPLAANQELVDKLIHLHDLNDLLRRVDAAQKEITKKIFNLPIAKMLIDKLRQAQNEILAGKDHYDEADALITEVEHRLAFHQRMKEDSRKYAPRLLAFELFCMAIFGAGVAVVNFPSVPVAAALKNSGTLIDLTQFVNSMMWGGLGGVVGALYALWKHVSDDQDFDAQYWMWYVTNPILGVALGGLIFLMIQAGFLSLTAGETQAGIQSAAVIYVLSWICGFKQNVVYELVRRILDAFRISSNSSQPTTGAGEESSKKG
jgi:hypothetical protein